MSRYHDDWIIDSLLQPLYLTKLFSIPDAINLLKDSHIILMTLPKFVQDWRWYKDVISDDTGVNEKVLNSYYKSNLNFIDYRLSDISHSYDFGLELENIGLNCWNLMCKIETGDEKAFDVFNNKIINLIKLIEPYSKETTNSLISSLSSINSPNLKPADDPFAEWWGRGQQYASFVSK